MKNLLLALLFLISFYELKAQSIFRKGFIITNQGDTTMGSLSVSNNNQLKFKAAGNEEAIRYQAGEIAGYGYDKDRFFRSHSMILAEEKETVQEIFLEVLVSGGLSLFRYKDKFFLSDDDILFSPLEDEGVIEARREKMVKMGANKYKGVLLYYLEACPSLHGRVKDIILQEKLLVELVADYNQCASGSYEEYKTTKDWIKVSPAISLGLIASQLSFTASQYDNQWTYYRSHYLIESDFSISYSPTVGMMFDFSSPRTSDRLFFQTGALYSKSKYEDSFTKKQYAWMEYNEISIEMHELTVPFGLKYVFPTESISPYLSLGVSSTFFLSSKSHFKQEREYDTSTTNTEREAVKTKTGYNSIWTAAGMSKNVWHQKEGFLEVRFTHSGLVVKELSNPFEDPILRPSITSLTLLMGLRF